MSGIPRVNFGSESKEIRYTSPPHAKLLFLYFSSVGSGHYVTQTSPSHNVTTSQNQAGSYYKALDGRMIPTEPIVTN